MYEDRAAVIRWVISSAIMRGLPQSAIIPQKCQLAIHTERLLDRSVFISTPETKRIADKNGRVCVCVRVRERATRRSKFDYRANKVAFNNVRDK